MGGLLEQIEAKRMEAAVEAERAARRRSASNKVDIVVLNYRTILFFIEKEIVKIAPQSRAMVVSK